MTAPGQFDLETPCLNCGVPIGDHLMRQMAACGEATDYNPMPTEPTDAVAVPGDSVSWSTHLNLQAGMRETQVGMLPVLIFDFCNEMVPIAFLGEIEDMRQMVTLVTTGVDLAEKFLAAQQQ